MKIRIPLCILLIVQALALVSISATAQCPTVTGEVLTPGETKANSIRAQMWFNDGVWWGAFSDDSAGVHFYKFSGSTATKGALIDSETNGLTDALWDGTNLFVIIRKSTTLATLYKYSYDSNSDSYALVSGFPVNLQLFGKPTSAVILEKDSTGKLWATYTGTEGLNADGKVRVIWSTSSDHTQWETEGYIIASGLDPQDSEGSGLVRFDGNKIGLVWSDQSSAELAFRYHVDGDPETSWVGKEIIDSGLGPRGIGPVANDQFSIKAAPDGRIFFVVKDNDNSETPGPFSEGQIWLYIRSTDGAWGQKTLVQQDSSHRPTRPILLLDVTSNLAYVIYHDESVTGPERNFITHASMNNPSFGQPCIFTETPATNPTSTKQNLTYSMGLVAVGSTDDPNSQLVFRSIDLPSPLPAMSHISPQNAPVGGSLVVITVHGSNFIDGSVIQFNGSDRPTTFVSGTELTAVLSASDLQNAGVFTITVVNPSPGGGSSSGASFTVNNLVPTLGSLSQNSASAGSTAITLTVHGTNFVNTSVVRFNGSDRSTTFVSSTELTAVITLADLQSAGVFAITVANPAPGGGTSGALNFTVNNLLPTLTGLSHTSASAGAAAFTLTVQGSNFVNNSVVRFNGNDHITSFVSSTELTVQITQADLQTAGVFSITVANPAPGGGSSPGLNFTVNNLLPTLTSLSQSSATAGTAAFTLTVQGTNFVNNSVVRFGGSDRSTTFVSSTELKAQITLADLQAAGVFPITVASPAPGGGSSAGLDFTVNNLLPTLTSMSRNSAAAGEPSFLLTVNGSNFINGSMVRLNGSDRATSFVNSTQLTAVITVADLQAAGVFPVTVVNPAPGGGSSSALNFTVNNLLPTLTSLSQSSAAAGSAAFMMTVQGTNFVSGSVVRINGNARTTSFVSSTQLTAQITLADLQNAGVFAITVASPAPGGGNSNGLNFTVNNLLPTLTSLSQTTASAGAAAFTMTVQGTNFVNGSVVRFGASDRTTSFVSSTQLTAQITLADLQAAGIFPVTVSSPAPGGGNSNVLNFTVNNLLPTLTNLSQTSAATGAAAFTMTVQGTNFVNSSVVRFNGSPRTTSFVSSTQLTAQITLADLQAAGVFAITVANPTPGGGNSSGLNFTVNNLLPTLTSLSQTSAAAGAAAFTMTVQGTNFVNGSVVRFGGSDRTTTYVSSTQLTAQITLADLQNAGNFAITVANPTPGGGNSSGLNFTVNNLLPTLTSLSQTSASTGAAAFTLTVQGTNFVNGSVVRFGGSDRTTAFVSGTKLTAQITVADLQAAGVFAISVANPTPGGGNSSSLNFTVNNVLPTLTSLSQTSASAGSAALTLTVQGTNFVNGSVVRFGGSDRSTTFVSSTQLSAQITPADLQAAGVFAISVANPTPGGGSSSGLNFTVNNLLPALTSLSQTSASAGDAAFTMTVHGTNFVNGSVVHFNGTGRTTSFISSTQLTALISLADLQAAGVFSVTVANPAPGGGSSSGLNFTVNNLLPTLTSMSQTNASAGAASFTLTVHGTNFVNGSIVSFNGAARNTAFVSSNELTAQVTLADLQAAGVFPVTVANPAPGGGSSSGLNFTVNNLLPTLTSLSQSSASAGDAAFTLTVHGTNFINGSVVSFNGSSRNTAFVSSTELTAQITLADQQTAGVFGVAVANPAPGGGNSNTLNFTVNNLLPALTSLSQTNASAGATGFTMTVQGTNFVNGSVVQFNGAGRTTSFVSSTELTVLIPQADLQAAGVFAVKVANPAPGGGSSSSLDFTVNNLLPTLTSLSQSSASAGDAGFTITVHGTNFVNGSVVHFNGAGRTTSFISSTELTALISLADLQAAGVFPVTVANPAPGGGNSSGLNFTVNNLLPTLSSLSQTVASAGSAAFTLTVHGTNFINGSVVSFNGAGRNTAFVSSTELTAQITLADLQAAGVYSVTVANPAPGGGSSSGLNFTVNNLLPTLTSLSQSTASAGAAALTVTVEGTNFINGSVVRFNGSDRTTAFISATQLTVQITPADLQAAGVFPVTVANPAPGGGSSSGLNFTVNNLLPTLTSLSQSSASAGDAAFTMTVQGTNFIDGSSVRFNGSARNTTFVSATELKVQITLADLQAAGVFPVTVANPAPGGGSSSGLNFTVNNLLPTLTSLSQTGAATGAAAFTLTVQGTNFVTGSMVRFNGSDRATSYVSATQLTAQITLADLQTAGVYGISVSNPLPGGGVTAELNFTVSNQLPTLTSLSRNSSSVGALGFSLTVQGTNFVNGSVIRFNGSDRTTSFVSATQLTAQITLADLQTAGIFAITVANPAPGGGASTGLDFTVNNLVPTLTSLSQNSISAGEQSFTLTVHGTNFINGSIVRFHGSDRNTTYVSSTQLTAQITVADLQTAGVFPITVANPTPGGGTSSSLNLTVNNLMPTLSSLSQNTATAGDSGFTLTLNGSNFTNGSVVRFNGNDRTTSFVSSTQLTATVTAADLATVGTFAVRVFSPQPGGGQSNSLDFTVAIPPAKLQFEASHYTVNESDNSIEITVTRTGDSSQPVSVDYATDDSNVFIPCVTPTGAASQRCDYVTTGGTLSLGAGETRKTFKVLLYEDVYLEGSETFGITLSNSAGATLGNQPTLTVTIMDNDFVAPFYNPINEPSFFVKRHYLDLLNRLPDEGGLNYWAYQILQCGADEACIQDRRTGVSAAFFIELEFQQTGYVVYRLHKAAFGQNPTYDRFMRDRGQLVVGPQLQATTNQFSERFVARPEFLQEYPASMSPRDFVDHLFNQAGLINHDAEREQEIDAMTNQGKTRSQVMLDVINLQEFKQREYNRAFVLMQYFGYLRRDPDQGGYDYWVNILNNTEPDNYRGMVCAFITSKEYQERTSTVLKVSNSNCGQ